MKANEVANANEVAKVNERDLKAKYIAIFSTPEGQVVLQDLAIKFWDRMSFDSDPHKTAFNEGQRSMFAYIYNQITKQEI